MRGYMTEISSCWYKDVEQRVSLSAVCKIPLKVFAEHEGYDISQLVWCSWFTKNGSLTSSVFTLRTFSIVSAATLVSEKSWRIKKEVNQIYNFIISTYGGNIYTLSPNQKYCCGGFCWNKWRFSGCFSLLW